MAGAAGNRSDEEPSNPDEEGIAHNSRPPPPPQAEILSVVSQDVPDQCPMIFRNPAGACLQLVFGVDVKEVDPGEHSYVLVTILGLTCDWVLLGKQAMPTTSLLVVVLGVILLEGECAPEEEVWKVLGVLGGCAGREHLFYGEPRELLTDVWVQDGYLVYRQVPGSEPARYEFLWGPRAHAETSSVHVLQHILMVSRRRLGASLSPCHEAASNEEERA
ncbi:LOW QUALITY PROTEIN: melanoma-associated antigen 11-like [Hyaena hyaena]|uniref:LOW QUALITY PROTEIN: melanoma-associated antigen 11-like n=1 Tax=Hyaena hyaena TaxID=95912 RepID=UPI00192389ED|nr:LOW QUALITY PROTEIN: melanoma-associated antigen 11-like [Hyaena hyaena]